MSPRSSLWANLGVGICAVALSLGLLGQLGRWSDHADVVNFVAPIWSAVGLSVALLVLICATQKYQRLFACCTIALLGIFLFTLASRNAAADPASDCAGAPLRLIQFNILKDNADVRPALVWIRGTGADVVVLEEAAGELSIADKLRPEYPYAVACAAALRCSTMILSRRPFAASGGLARGDPENRKALSAAWATLASPAGAFTIVGAHLSRPWPWHFNPTERPELAAFVRQQDAGTTLVSGDFNIPGWTFQLRQLATMFGLQVAPNIRSWPATSHWPPLWAIDHLFVGGRWSVERLVRGPMLGSDHYPLLADLRLHGTCRP